MKEKLTVKLSRKHVQRVEIKHLRDMRIKHRYASIHDRKDVVRDHNNMLKFTKEFDRMFLRTDRQNGEKI
jgi:hypothetical protein